MVDDSAVGSPAPAATPAPSPWYQGVVDADVLGNWQNKGYDLSDPIKVAVEAGKAARELERMVGVPKDQLLRLPANNVNDPAAWRPVYERLGAPKDAKDYDFNLKYSDGDPLEASLADSLRSAFHARGVPKDAALDITKAVMKEAELNAQATAAQRESAKADALARLTALWGPRIGENTQTAQNGAARLGMTKDEVIAIENAIGHDRAAEMFRQYGDMSKEDKWRDGGQPPGTPPTADAAKARWNELKADPAFQKRLLSKDAEAMRQYHDLMAQITNVNEAYELANLGR